MEAEKLSTHNQPTTGVRVLIDLEPAVEPIATTVDETVIDAPTPPATAMAIVPAHEEPPAQAHPRKRTLSLQLRYSRSLLWAAWLFARILYWEWVVKPIRGAKFVQDRNLQRWKHYARQFRYFAGDMGGVFIKAGQFISTRADIFPEEIINEMAGLQDEVPTIPYDQIDGVLKRELGETYRDRFDWINEEPIAAASLGQVHRAKLKEGDRVVVKVQRPGIIDIVATDLDALLVVARVAMRFKFISRRVNAVEVTEEFGRVLWEEVSYRHEAYNAKLFNQMFKDDLGIYIPAVYDAHSTDRVLTLEDVTSIKINDYKRLEEAGIKREEVARRLMNSYFRQVFDDRFFHADPHPGNLFVYPLPIEEGASFGATGRPFYLIYIDFGMTSRLTQQLVDGLISTMIAVITRDAHKLILSYKELDLLLPSADLERLEQATKATFDQVWGMSMSDLSNVDYKVMESLGAEFYDLIFDMPFQMPQNFIYLGRTMGILSGLCTSLDPKFNPWHELQPYTAKLMQTRNSQGATLGNELGNSLLSNLFGTNARGNLLEVGTQLFNRAVNPNNAITEQLIQQLKSGDIRVTAEPSRKFELQTKLLDMQIRRGIYAVVFGSVLVASTLLLVNDYAWVAYGGFAFSAWSAWRVMFPPIFFE